MSERSSALVHPLFRLRSGDVEFGADDLSPRFEMLSGQLKEAGVSAGEIIWVDARHELAHAVLFLFLLEQRFGFVTGRSASQVEAGVPQFCRWVATVANSDSRTRDLNLQLRSNTDFSDSAAQRIVPWVFFATSGSTGAPRLVAHDHGKLLRNAAGCVERFGLDASSRIALPVPIWHMFGFGAGFLPAVMAGAAVDLQSDSNVLRYQQRETEFAPNVSYLTPAQVNGINRIKKKSRPYRLTVVAGDLLRPEVFREYEAHAGSLVQLYGSSELGAIAASSPGDDVESRLENVGTPMPGVECRISSDRGTLQCRHPAGFEAYVTADGVVEHQSPEAWVDTHDLAQISDAGWIKILGRADHRINRDGILVDLHAVASAVESVPGVRSCCCIGNGNGPRGREIVAFCVREQDANHGPDEIRRVLQRRLAPREVPDRVMLLPELPLLGSGKIDRQRLAAYLQETDIGAS